MITGITISLYVKTQTGVDEFNRPVYEDIPEDVENVLVGEPTTNDIENDLTMYGKECAYVLGIPKGDTHDWEDCIVEFDSTGTGDKTHKYRVYGNVTAGIEENIPLVWNKKVRVERYGTD